MSHGWKLSETELRDNTAYLSTVQEARHGDSSIVDAIQVVFERFKFSYGGYNGFLTDRIGLENELKDIFDHEFTMRKIQERREEQRKQNEIETQRAKP